MENASIKIKDCKIILSIASKGNDGSDIETDITIGEIKDGENQLEKIAYIIANNNTNGTNDKLVSQLINSLFSGTSFTEFDKDARYVPNYTGESIKSAFPDLKWGEYVGNVLVVQELPAASGVSKNAFGFKAIKLNADGTQSAVYVIPTSELRNFARYTRIQEAARKLSEYKFLTEDEIYKMKTFIEQTEAKLKDITPEDYKTVLNEEEYNTYIAYLAALSKDEANRKIIEDIEDLRTYIESSNLQLKTTQTDSTGRNLSADIRFLINSLDSAELRFISTKSGYKKNFGRNYYDAISVWLRSGKDENGKVDPFFLRVDDPNYVSKVSKIGYAELKYIVDYLQRDEHTGISPLHHDLRNLLDNTDAEEFIKSYKSLKEHISQIEQYAYEFEKEPGFKDLPDILKIQRIKKLLDDCLSLGTYVEVLENKMADYDKSGYRTINGRDNSLKIFQEFIANRPGLQAIAADEETRQQIVENIENKLQENLIKKGLVVQEESESNAESIVENAQKEAKIDESKSQEENLKTFLNSIINGDSNISNLALKSYEVDARINDILIQLSGYKSKRTSESNFVNFLTYLLQGIQNTKFIPYNIMGKYMVETGMIQKDDIKNINLIRQKVQKLFLESDVGFYETNFGKSTSGMYFKRQSKTTYGLLSIKTVDAIRTNEDEPIIIKKLNEVYNISPLTDDDTGEVLKPYGFYVYNYGGKYFITQNPWSRYDKYIKLFSSKNEAQKAAYETFLKSTVFSGFFINRALKKGRVEYDPMESPKSRWYKKGQIVEVLDAEFGNIESVRQDLTVKDYFESILKTAPGNLGAYIISKLNTVEKVALFYSRFGLNLSIVSDNNIRAVLDELSKAKTDSYIAVDNTVAIGHKSFGSETRSFYTRFRKMSDEDFQIKEEKVSEAAQIKKGRITRIVDWQTIQHIFEENGIKMVLLTDEQVKSIIGQDSKEKLRGFTQNGIIYINPKYASFQSPFHEYTHILLSLVRHRDQDVYVQLLEAYCQEKYKLSIKDVLTSGKLTTNEFYKRQIEEQGLNEKEHAAEIAMYILEEEFADDFAKFISEQNVSFPKIFASMKTIIEKDDIFGETFNLFDVANGQFNIFKSLLNGFEKDRKRIGFGIRGMAGTSGFKTELISQIQQMLEDDRDKIYDVSKNDLEKLQGVEENKDGIYRYCK